MGKKLTGIMPGADRHIDFYLAYADFLAVSNGMHKHIDGVAHWLIPELAGESAGSKVSEFVKALQTKGKTGARVKYEAVAVASLPENPTAAGFRRGAVETLSLYVPAEIAVHTFAIQSTGTTPSPNL